MFRHLAISVVAGAVLLAAAPSSAEQAVRLRFAATVGETPVACDAAYQNIGVTKSTIHIVDLRFYVSRLRLLKADGTEQPVTLTQDGLWQHDDVALLDFEDASGGCANGTEQTRDLVEGSVAAGEYVGVRFDLGLPFEKNHRDPTLQPSPLNLSRLFWSWNAGYKFLRLDLQSTGQPRGWMFHLGSTGCMPNDSRTTVPVSCARPNITTIDLPAFDLAADVVELDLQALLATSDVDRNAPETPAGCMSGPSDPECGPLLTRFGFQPAEGELAAPAVFRVRRAAGTAH